MQSKACQLLILAYPTVYTHSVLTFYHFHPMYSTQTSNSSPLKRTPPSRKWIHIHAQSCKHPHSHALFHLTHPKPSDMSGILSEHFWDVKKARKWRKSRKKKEWEWEWGKRDSTVMLLKSDLWSLCIYIQAYSPHLPTSTACCWWHQPRQRGLGCSRCIMWVA